MQLRCSQMLSIWLVLCLDSQKKPARQAGFRTFWSELRGYARQNMNCSPTVVESMEKSQSSRFCVSSQK